jgi:hypothetical protein
VSRPSAGSRGKHPPRPFDPVGQLGNVLELARWYCAQLLAWNKRFDEAYEFMDQLDKDMPKSFLGEIILFLKYALKGEKEIRGEERFKKLIQRVKYEWEHFEV